MSNTSDDNDAMTTATSTTQQNSRPGSNSPSSTQQQQRQLYHRLFSKSAKDTTKEDENEESAVRNGDSLASDIDAVVSKDINGRGSISSRSIVSMTQGRRGSSDFAKNRIRDSDDHDEDDVNNSDDEEMKTKSTSQDEEEESPEIVIRGSVKHLLLQKFGRSDKLLSSNDPIYEDSATAVDSNLANTTNFSSSSNSPTDQKHQYVVVDSSKNLINYNINDDDDENSTDPKKGKKRNSSVLFDIDDTNPEVNCYEDSDYVDDNDDEYVDNDEKMVDNTVTENKLKDRADADDDNNSTTREKKKRKICCRTFVMPQMPSEVVVPSATKFQLHKKTKIVSVLLKKHRREISATDSKSTLKKNSDGSSNSQTKKKRKKKIAADSSANDTSTLLSSAFTSNFKTADAILLDEIDNRWCVVQLLQPTFNADDNSGSATAVINRSRNIITVQKEHLKTLSQQRIHEQQYDKLTGVSTEYSSTSKSSIDDAPMSNDTTKPSSKKVKNVDDSKKMSSEAVLKQQQQRQLMLKKRQVAVVKKKKFIASTNDEIRDLFLSCVREEIMMKTDNK